MPMNYYVYIEQIIIDYDDKVMNIEESTKLSVFLEILSDFNLVLEAICISRNCLSSST